MRTVSPISRFPRWLPLVATLLLAVAGPAAADKKPAPPMARVRIEVTAGDLNKPVMEASVYVKFPINPAKPGGKTIDINLKTSEEGTLVTPEIPQGRILIQIIAEGWKTFGQWYDISQPEQTVQIHLVRPPVNPF